MTVLAAAAVASVGEPDVEAVVGCEGAAGLEVLPQVWVTKHEKAWARVTAVAAAEEVGGGAAVPAAAAAEPGEQHEDVA